MKKLIISSMIMFSSLGIAQNLILDGQIIPLEQTSPMSIDTATGNVIITSQNGNLSCAEIGDPPTLGLTINTTEVDPGGSAIITWTVGNNATSCTRTGDWSGTLTGDDVLNGNHLETITNITENMSFQMSCTNNFGSSPTRTVSVEVDNGTQTCPDQLPILNGAEDRTIRLIAGAFGSQLGTPGNPASYNGLYTEIVNGGGQWPGTTGGQSFATLTSGQYASMQFTTSNLDIQGQANMIPPGNAQGPGSTGVTMSISECPGDFTTTVNQSTCLTVGGGSINLRWSQEDNPPATHCQLEKNTTYYFNVVHSNSVSDNFSTTTCSNSSGYCGIIFSNQ